MALNHLGKATNDYPQERIISDLAGLAQGEFTLHEPSELTGKNTISKLVQLDRHAAAEVLSDAGMQNMAMTSETFSQVLMMRSRLQLTAFGIADLPSNRRLMASLIERSLDQRMNQKDFEELVKENSEKWESPGS